MTTEQDKTVKALQTAIQMEIDGKDFYLKAAASSKTAIGRKLLARLAEEEDIHRQVFEHIFRTIQNKHGWPVLEKETQRQYTTSLSNLFSELANKTGLTIPDMSSELDIVQAARQMEANTYDFYTRRSREASAKAEQELFSLIAEQEQGHNLALADYYELLQDPAGWFVKKEHPLLD